MKTIYTLICLFITIMLCNGQTITGYLPQLANQEIKLEGFNGLQTYTISKTTLDDKGNFTINYSKKDIGMGYLNTANSKPVFMVLSGEDIALQGEDLNAIESLKITKGAENIAFETYAKDHPKREQALSAWLYLEKIYTADPLFNDKKTAVQAIATEKTRIRAEDAAFITNLPKTSYVKWFLPLRKMISSVSTVAQYRTEEIPETVAAFRNLDFTDVRFYKSGLYKDAIDSHFWLLENSGNDFDTMYKEMEISIDAMLLHLVKDNAKLNEVTNHLFYLLERRSLFQASEYLAVKVLNEDSCVLERDLAMQLETYRAMKKGNIAPEMVFDKAFFANPSQAISNLSDVKSKFTLVVFAASWCPKCTEELPLIANYYNQWKAKGVEVLYIGLEDDRKSFTDFAAPFPFLSYSDLKKWGSNIVKDYYVFGTPTLFLLNEKREIVLRPTSVEQVNAWVKTYLGS